MESDGGGSRRRRSLSDEKIDSANLRDFLRVKEENDDERRHSLAGLTLSAILASEKRPQVNRTLLDIIRDDPNGGFKDNKKSWKSFKDKLRLRRAGAAWTSTVHIPTSDVPIQNNNNRMISRRNSTRFPTNTADDDPTPAYTRPELSSSSSGTINVSETRADTNPEMNNRAMMMRRNSSRIPSLASSREGRPDHAVRREGSLNFSESLDHHRPVLSPEEDETEEGVGETAEEGEGQGGGGGEQPVRMSLMALLAETDREMGLDGSTYMMNDEEDDDDDDDDDEEVEESGGRGVGEYNNCCVCMVRHKGSAFIPCGHTFCRLCSRELWVQRGNCPLCNGFILEILDIF